jgi:quercetin dioxygenase-like cupin family protein
VKVSRHEAMMFGLDAPAKSDVVAHFTGQPISDEELDAGLARLTEQERETFMMLLQKLQGRWVEPPPPSIETTAVVQIEPPKNASGSGESNGSHSATTRRDANMTATKGFVVPEGGGRHLDMATPGRFAALKLLGHETNESIMLFEETLPLGTKSLFHLHRDSDEVAWVLAGEITFKIGDEVTVGGPGTCAFLPRNVPHAWKNTGSEIGRVLFL